MLAVRSAQLSLTLQEEIGEHADHLGDKVKVKIDEVTG
jgi:hypothetical protein